jgi:hypothetical protein
MYAGAGFGFAHYYLIRGAFGPNKGTQGFVIPLAGLTEEEREKQRAKDLIQELGNRPHIKHKAMIDL